MIFEPEDVGREWDAIAPELERAFRESREAAKQGANIVYLVHHDDLLGRRGAPRAMIACGLLSAARTAAIEGSRKGWSANVVAYDDAAGRPTALEWARRLEDDPAGVTGELVRVGSSHMGKALP